MAGRKEVYLTKNMIESQVMSLRPLAEEMSRFQPW
jgi:hypothetical protein